MSTEGIEINSMKIIIVNGIDTRTNLLYASRKLSSLSRSKIILGRCYFRNPFKWKILIVRNKWFIMIETLFHELGHVILDTLQPRPQYEDYQSFIDKSYDNLASWFWNKLFG